MAGVAGVAFAAVDFSHQCWAPRVGYSWLSFFLFLISVSSLLVRLRLATYPFHEGNYRI